MPTQYSNVITLAVFTKPGEDEEFKRVGFFCCKRERLANGMSKFSRKTRKLSYTDKLVSTAVLRMGEKICESATTIYGEIESANRAETIA